MNYTDLILNIRKLKTYGFVRVMNVFPERQLLLLKNREGTEFELSNKQFESELVENIPTIVSDELLNEPEFRTFYGGNRQWVFAFKNVERLKEVNTFYYKSEAYQVIEIAEQRATPQNFYNVFCK